MKSVLIEMEKLKNPNSGLGQFCLHLGLQFQQLKPSHLNLHYYLPPNQQNIFGNKSSTVKQSAVHKFLSLNSKPYQVWHCLHQNSSYLPSQKNTKLILTIHDLNFLEKYKGIKRALKLGALQKRVDRAHTITVISHYTEKMARDYLDLGDKSVHVIPNGNTLDFISNPKKPEYIQFILPILTSMDYSIIPTRSLDTDGKIIDYRNTSGPYYVKEENDNQIVLAANPNHINFDEEMPQTINIIRVMNHDAIEKFKNNEVDVIDVTMYPRSNLYRKLFEDKSVEFTSFKTLPMNLLYSHIQIIPLYQLRHHYLLPHIFFQ